MRAAIAGVIGRPPGTPLPELPCWFILSLLDHVALTQALSRDCDVQDHVTITYARLRAEQAELRLGTPLFPGLHPAGKPAAGVLLSSEHITTLRAARAYLKLEPHFPEDRPVPFSMAAAKARSKVGKKPAAALGV